MRDLLYKNCDMCLVVYSVTDYESFSEVEKFIETVRKVKIDSKCAPIPFLIFANKTDLHDNRKVNFEHAQELERRLNVPVVEGSCKEHEPILEIGRQLVRLKFTMEGNEGNNRRRRRCIIM
jgi:GTPase SAR1 family protein